MRDTLQVGLSGVALVLALASGAGCGGDETPGSGSGADGFDADADAGAGGEITPGGDGAEADAPSDTASAQTERELLVAGLVREGACTGAELGARLRATLPSLGALPGPRDAALARAGCLVAAATCDEVLACDGLDTDRPCSRATFQQGCDEATRRWCAQLPNGLSFVGQEDCASRSDANTQCLRALGQVAWCGTGSCAGNSARCDGDTAVICQNLVEVQTTCPASTGCAEHGGSVTCDPPIDCDEAWGRSCDGGWSVQCHDGREQARTDCAAWLDGGLCDPDTKACVVPEAAVSCEEPAASCAGSVAHVCVAGTLVDLDCGAFLDGACLEDFDGVRCGPGSGP